MLAGAEKVMVCAAFVTAKLWLTLGAAAYVTLPACEARIVHVPAATMATVAPLIVQVVEVNELKVTGRPEDAEALIGNAAAPKIFPGSAAKLIVWLFCALAGREAANQRGSSSDGAASASANSTRSFRPPGRCIEAMQRFSGKSLVTSLQPPAVAAPYAPRDPASYACRLPLCS
ncbi:MAG: hypothetical protein ACREYB_09075 [Casimicrobiaceae bacterium]